VLLARTNQGYKNLCRLVSDASAGKEERHGIDKDAIMDYSEGLIGLSGCLQGEIPQLILAGRMDAAMESVSYYKQILGEGNFFLEVQKTGLQDQTKVNRTLLELGQMLSVPLVATNNCHYLHREDARDRDILHKIGRKDSAHSLSLSDHPTDELYVKSPGRMKDDFTDFPGAIESTELIASSCNVHFALNKYRLPKYDSKKNSGVLLALCVRDGLDKRLNEKVPQGSVVDKFEYDLRIEKEVKTLATKGLEDFVLLIADLVRHLKEDALGFVSGMDDANGSLVLYALGITHIDPVSRGLTPDNLWDTQSRFLPQFKLCIDEQNEKSINKFMGALQRSGRYIAQGADIATMSPRNSVINVGIELGIPLVEIDQLMRSVINLPFGSYNLDQHIRWAMPDVMEKINSDPVHKEWIDISRRIGGLPTGISNQQNGWIIGEKPFTNYFPCTPVNSNFQVAQWGETSICSMGLPYLKFKKFRTNSIDRLVRKNLQRQGISVADIGNLPLDDARTYDLISRSDTMGCRYMTASGIRDLIGKAKPKSFNELAALMALYRPSTLDSGITEEYVKSLVKNRPAKNWSSLVDAILSETNGVLVYQEQCVALFEIMGLDSLSAYREFTVAIANEDRDTLSGFRRAFTKGAREAGVGSAEARGLLEYIEKYSRYPITKAKSMFIAMIGYRAAYFKANFLPEFMAWLLSTGTGFDEEFINVVKGCKNNSIDILLPDINSSECFCTVEAGKIRLGLTNVQTIDEKKARVIVLEREKNGKFTNLNSFHTRTTTFGITTENIMAMVHAGAFDYSGQYRSQMCAMIEMPRTDDHRIDINAAQNSDRNSENITDSKMSSLTQLAEWDLFNLMTKQRDAIGAYVGGHPLDIYKEKIDERANANTSSIVSLGDKQEVCIAGLIKTIKKIRNKKGNLLAFCMLEDQYGEVEIVIFPHVLEKLSIKCDMPSLIVGKVDEHFGTEYLKIWVEQLESLGSDAITKRD
jgi:DNA polymerase-3 subunit alpha